MHYIDIIFLLIIIAFIYIRLKKVLGTRPDANQSKISDQTAEKIFDLIVKEVRSNEEKEAINKGEIKPVNDNKEISDLDKKLSKIPNFNKEKFINNSKKAFEIISSAFNSGDVEDLEMLVNKNLIKKFKEVIEKRNKEGITSESDLISFSNVEINDAKISRAGIAQVSLKFISEQINIIKNKKDEIIEGDENFIQNITDIWTFERDINSNNPTWLLCSTKK